MSIGSLANVSTMNLLFQNSTFGPSSECGQVMQNSKVCIPQHQRLLYSGNNVDVYSYYYKDANGALCSWEGVEKQTGAPGSKSSKTTMCTIAVLKRQIRCDCLLLVRQYRAPVGKYTIEFPATVVDGQGNIDHVVEAANREIQDETGYTSTTFKHISPDTAMDADVTDGKVKLVSVSIDGDDPLQHATPANTFSFESGHGHIVQLLQLPLNGLLERLQTLAEHDLIDSRVYAYAMGLQEGEKIALSNMLAKEELNEM